MPVVKFFGRLDLDPICLFLDGHKLGRAFGAATIENGPHHNVIMLRPSLFHDYMTKGIVLTRNNAWIFSMWSSYLKKPEYDDLRSAFEKAGARFTMIHTSGHASRRNLQNFDDRQAEKIAADYTWPQVFSRTLSIYDELAQRSIERNDIL